MTLRSLDLQENAMLTARLKEDEDLRAAIADLRGCLTAFSAMAKATDAGLLAFVASQNGHNERVSVAELANAVDVRLLARRFLDWSEEIERANIATRDRSKQGYRELELELLGAAQRQREIAAEVERIETAMTACSSDAETRRRKVEAAGVPHNVARSLYPDLDRKAMSNRRADLLDESSALSRFIATYDLRRLPPSFGSWFESWKSRCGVVEAKAA